MKTTGSNERDAPPAVRRLVSVSHHAEIVGGGEISLLTLLGGLDRRRWSPHLVTPREGELARRARDLGVPVDFVPMPGLKLPRPAIVIAVLRLARLLRDSEADLVHANGSRAMFYSGLAGRLAGLPVIWHLRVLDPDRRLDWALLRLADGVIAISSEVRDRLGRRARSPERCRVIPNGLDLESYVPTADPETTRRGLDLVPSDRVVVTVGRMVPFKRQDLLLEAIAALREELPRLRCVIVGDGPERSRLERRAAELGVADLLRLPGHRDDVPDLLAAADVFALPSPAEHFGRVVIEAMAVGVPVVAAAAAGPAEILEDGITGVLVTPGSSRSLARALRRVLENPAAGDRLASAARAKVEEHYSMEEHARRVQEFLDDLLEDAG